jgi:hypothetical protein
VARQRLPSCISRPAVLLGFLRPSQVYSRGRVSRRFRRSGPTCRFARRASAPISFRRGDQPPGGEHVGKGGWPGTLFCTRRSTSGLHSRLRSASRSTAMPKHRLPWDRSCLGLCLLQGWRALDCASKPGSTPNSIISLREHADRFHANSASLSAHGFQAASADCEPARLPSLQRIDGADAWLTWTASRAARANSLSEVLHRP